MSLKRINISEIANIIDSNHLDYEDIFDRMVLNKIISKWTDIVGPVLEKNVFPVGFSKKKLFLGALHPAYKQEISFLNEKIIKNINSIYNQPVLEKIIFNTTTNETKQDSKSKKPKAKKVK